VKIDIVVFWVVASCNLADVYYVSEEVLTFFYVNLASFTSSSMPSTYKQHEYEGKFHPITCHEGTEGE
jgi:hypothetical protein